MDSFLDCVLHRRPVEVVSTWRSPTPKMRLIKPDDHDPPSPINQNQCPARQHMGIQPPCVTVAIACSAARSKRKVLFELHGSCEHRRFQGMGSAYAPRANYPPSHRSSTPVDIPLRRNRSHCSMEANRWLDTPRLCFSLPTFTWDEGAITVCRHSGARYRRIMLYPESDLTDRRDWAVDALHHGPDDPYKITGVRSRPCCCSEVLNQLCL